MNLMPRLRMRGADSHVEAREYEEMLARPDHHMWTVLLTGAFEQGADAICIGFRPDIFEDPDSKELRRKSAEVFAGWTAFECEMHRSMAALEQSAYAREPRGGTGLPISFRIAGTLRYFNDQPFHLWGMILRAIQLERLVALGASEAHPQPMRYVEIGYGMSKKPVTSGTSGLRRFIEIDMEFQEDNSFWVYIRGVREAGPEVRVSRGIF
jgi:hypothetical protein